MNIIVIANYYPTASDPQGGIFVQHQVQALIEAGCRVKVLAPVPWAPFPLPLLSQKWAGYHRTPRSDLKGNLDVYYPRYLSLPRSWSFAQSGQRMYAGLRGLVTALAESFPPDLIQAHGALPAGHAAMRVGADLQVPFLVTVHGGDLQRTIHFNQDCKDAVGEVFDQSAAVVLVSEKLKRIAEEQFGKAAHYRVIPNGIDPNLIARISHRQPPSGGSERTLLSVSNLYPAKGIDLNLRAVQRLIDKHSDLKYQIIGAGPERRALLNLVHELGISDQVEFLGQLPHDQALAAMAACEVFSLPSWQEGFGIVYLEAMALGKPVVGCRGQGIEDFVVDGETGYLVNPRDVDDLAHILDDLLDHPQKRARIGQRAQSQVLADYTWERNARRTIELYREIMADVP